MKIKYYLRGLGVGIVITTLILLIVFNTTGKNISDEEIISRAKELGMVMEEADEEPVSGKLTESFGKDKQEIKTTTPVAVTSEGSIEDEAKADDTKTDDTKTDAKEEKDSDPVESKDKDKEKKEEDALEGTTNSISPNGKKASVNVVKGDSSRIVSEKLQAAGIVGNAEDFNKFMKNGGYADKIKVGRVTINIGETYNNIAKILTEK